MRSFRRRAAALGALGLLLLAGAAQAAEIHVMNSGGFTAAYRALTAEFERSTGHTLVTAYGASMGNAPDAIPQRLARGEPADVLIMAAESLDGLVAGGRVAPGSRTDLAESRIGAAVRAGAPRPDISTVDALRRTLLAANSVAYSASASGTYLSGELFARLGIEDRMRVTARRIMSERVGTVVARGDAELGFQQISELLPIAGLDLLGPIPAEVQRVTTFSAGLTTAAREPEAARALLRFLASPAAEAAIRASGLDPMPR